MHVEREMLTEYEKETWLMVTSIQSCIESFPWWKEGMKLTRLNLTFQVGKEECLLALGPGDLLLF